MTMASASTVQCPLCSQPNFVSIDSLRSSLISVTNRPLMCPICNDIQMGLDKLTIHLLSHTIKSSAFVDTCADLPPIHTVPTAASTSHANDALDISIDRTDTVTNTSSSCVATHPFVDEVPDCQFCGCTFRTAELRRMHMHLVHELFIDTPATGHDSAHFQCVQCPKRFRMEGSLHLHCRMVHGKLSAGVRRIEKHLPFIHKSTKLNVTNASDEVSNMKPDADGSNSSKECVAGAANSNSDEKTFECTTCSKSFTTKYFLKKHKRLHTGEMPYICQICNRTFTFQQSYHRHLSYHTDDRPHICTVCRRAFKELSTLHNHERIHSGEKPFQCETCDKCFRQRISYLVHRRIHTGVLPYDCRTCDKKFRYKISLRTHKCVGVVAAIQEIQPPLPPPLPSNDIETLPAVEDLLNLDCSRAIDEFVTESYNRMGIVDPHESTIENVPGQLSLTTNYFHYNIDATNNDPGHTGEHQEKHQPFENISSNIARLPSMREFMSPTSHQQPSIDAINELFLCHDEY